MGWGGVSKGSQQRWCLHTVLKDELKFMRLRGWGTKALQVGRRTPLPPGGLRGRNSWWAATGGGCMGGSVCGRWGVRDHGTVDVKVPGCLGEGGLPWVVHWGVLVLPPGPQPSLPFLNHCSL